MTNKYSLFFSFVLFLIHIRIQAPNVGINNPTPDASALLDMVSTDKGILIPRMTTTLRITIAAPATGLLVYDSDLNKFYFFNGIAWIAVGSNIGWSLTGDAGTASGTNFLGTTDNQPLLIKVNNTKAGFIDQQEGTFLGRNVFLGKLAGFNNTITGFDNTFIGAKAGEANTIGTLNTAVGAKSLQNAVATFSNTAIGRETMQQCISCVHSTAVGAGALQNIEGGFWNNAFGYLAMRQAANPGISNNAFGAETLFNNTGSDNCAFGHTALRQNTSGTYNIAFGSLSLYENNTGSYNIGMGAFALQNNSTGSYNTVLGYKCAADGLSNNRVVAIGDSTLYFNKASGIVAVGSRALRSNNGGTSNTAVGYESLYTNTIGNSNTALGDFSLKLNIVGNANTAIGSLALQNNNGNNNTAVGSGAQSANTLGKDNSSVGALTLTNNLSGNFNIAIGSNSLAQNISSHNNVGVGYNTLSAYNASGNTGNNTAIGTGAGDSYTSYSNCTFVGYQADANAASFSNSTAIGNGAIATASQQVKIGNATVTAIGGAVNWSIISDGRFKTNVKNNIPGLNFINRLNPVSYNYDIKSYCSFIGTDEHSFNDDAAIQQKEKIIYSGFIAQEVEEAAKNSGYNFSGIHKPENTNDTYTLSYADFVVPLVKAVQELTIQNVNLLKKIELLEAKYDLHKKQD
ncbi:MAG: tail fiber domain-containing protein [Bacteroidota bacterium]|nr:MAG: tail fiber domain-containing protein [Bacteroidota bacterium]